MREEELDNIVSTECLRQISKLYSDIDDLYHRMFQCRAIYPDKTVARGRMKLLKKLEKKSIKIILNKCPLYIEMPTMKKTSVDGVTELVPDKRLKNKSDNKELLVRSNQNELTANSSTNVEILD